MEYRYSNWLAYLFLGLIPVFVGLVIFIFATAAPDASGALGLMVFSGFWLALLMALAIAYLYFSRYRLLISDEWVTIKGPFRVKKIPISQIAQIITVSTPRGGTGSFLLDKDNGVLAKLDDSLEGPGSAIVVLEQQVRPYHVTVYRRDVFGPWERRNAGDMHWSPSDTPKFVRNNDRGVIYILLVAIILIALMMVLPTWVNH